MKNTDTLPDDRSTSFGAVRDPTEEADSTYTPGEFLRQVGYIISICLGLALLAHVLLAVRG